MPNWCANTLEFHGITDERFNEIWADFYDTTAAFKIDEGIYRLRKLFILIYTGAVRVSSELYFEPPLVYLTEYGGAHINTNQPVDEEVSNIWRGILSVNQICPVLAEALGRLFMERCWECSITMEPDWLVDSQDFADSILGKAWYDYSPTDLYTTPTSPSTAFLDTRFEQPPVQENRLYHSMFTIIPPPALNEIVGYNNALFKSERGLHRFDSSRSSRAAYIDIYGVKWAGMWNAANVDRVAEFAAKHCICGDTPWSPLSIDYLEALAEKYNVELTHYYCEQGMAYCGKRVPAKTFRDIPEKLVGHETEDGEDYVIDGPEWVKEKVENYGG